MAATIFEPLVPLSIATDAIKPGRKIYIDGIPTGESFEIDLMDDEQNIAIHFNPIFAKEQVVMYSRLGGSCKQERRITEDFPFEVGKAFNIGVACEEKAFVITVNRHVVYEFPYCMSYEEITNILIDGKVVLSAVGLDSELQPQSDLELPNPFLMGLPPMVPGQIIRVEGMPQEGRFAINLTTGPEASDDIAFHFNPRFDSGNVIVRNTRVAGKWQKEERDLPGECEFSFKIGKPFKLAIICRECDYEVMFDGVLLLTFKHRLNYEYVKYLLIKGNITLTAVCVDFERKAPVSANYGLTAMKPVRSIYLEGIPTANGTNNQFSFSLQAGKNGNGTKALFFNARIHDKVLVMNSQLDGAWQKEEHHEIPFKIGERFKVIISCYKKEFRVSVNGNERTEFEFKHRMDCQVIRDLWVLGDVAVLEAYTDLAEINTE